MRPRLVFAASRPPFPTTYGAGIRTHRLLTGLAKSFDTTFVTFAYDGWTGEELGHVEIEQLLPDVEVVTVPGPSLNKRPAQVRSLLSPASWEFGRFRSPAFAKALTAAAAGAAVVHLDGLAVGSFGPFEVPLTAFAPHNVEHRVIQGTADVARGGRRAFAVIEWRKIKREEERVWRRMPLCIAVSQIDAAMIRASGASQVELCPNGVDPVERLDPPLRTAQEPLRILFVGNVTYQPNERGVAWFIREVLPLVRTTVPVRFDVVGDPPSRALRAEGVTYQGRVPSVQEWYERAHVAVVPVFHGSGTRLKVIEAMAYGRPVVSTGLGSEGLPVRPQQHYLQADDADAFARTLVSLAQRLGRRDEGIERLLSDARQAVSPLSWPRVVARLADLYASRLEQHAEPGR